MASEQIESQRGERKVVEEILFIADVSAQQAQALAAGGSAHAEADRAHFPDQGEFAEGL